MVFELPQHPRRGNSGGHRRGWGGDPHAHTPSRGRSTPHSDSTAEAHTELPTGRGLPRRVVRNALQGALHTGRSQQLLPQVPMQQPPCLESKTILLQTRFTRIAGIATSLINRPSENPNIWDTVSLY